MIIITRPEEQAQALAEKLKSWGRTSIFPLILINDPPGPVLWPNFPLDMLIFISPTSVNRFFSLGVPRNFIWPGRVAAIGKGTKFALKKYGIEALIPELHFNSEGLLAEPFLQSIKDLHIGLIKGFGGRDWLEKTLNARGAKVHSFIVYQRVPPPHIPWRQWQKQSIDAIVVTSLSALKNLWTVIESAGKSWVLQQQLLVISDSMKKTAIELGFQKSPWLARDATDEAIVEVFNAYSRIK